MNFPDDLRYTKEHEWARKESDNKITIGITEFAGESLGDIVFVELPEVGSEIIKESTFGVVESVKAVSDLYAPISGKITDVNTTLIQSPDMLNQDPYGEAWFIKIEPTNETELNSLMSVEDYKKFIDEQS